MTNDYSNKIAQPPNERAFRDALHICLVLTVMSCPISAQLMRQQAQFAREQPVQVDVRPVAQGVKAGQQTWVQVFLRNGDGAPTSAKEDTDVELQVIPSSGSVITKRVRIPRGESSAQVEVIVASAGLTKLAVKPLTNSLLAATNFVIVAPDSSPKATKNPTAHSKSKGSKAEETTHPDKGPGMSRRRREVHFIATAFDPQVAATPKPPIPIQSGSPTLMLAVSGENDAQQIRADGVAFARVQVFYIADSATSRDIQIWLQWSNGAIDQNPLIIRKGQFVGESHWTSTFPIPGAKVRIAAVNPSTLKLIGNTEATVNFVEPILGIGFVDPPEKITIVDTVMVTARFFDPAGNPIQTGTKRPFRFASSSPIIKLTPESDEVAAGKSEFSTLVLPTSMGSSKIEASIPGYPPVSYAIKVSGVSVILLCLVGGVLGGALGYINSKGSLLARVIAGVILGMLATWAYVYVGLPNTNTMILHNVSSVLFVSILAGFSGVKVVAVISKAMSFGF